MKDEAKKELLDFLNEHDIKIGEAHGFLYNKLIDDELKKAQKKISSNSVGKCFSKTFMDGVDYIKILAVMDAFAYVLEFFVNSLDEKNRGGIEYSNIRIVDMSEYEEISQDDFKEKAHEYLDRMIAAEPLEE